MKIVPCNICGGTEGKLVITYEGYDIVKCDTCGLVFVNSQYSDEELKEFYTRGYYTGKWERTYKDYVNEGEARISAFKGRVAELRQYAPGGKLLDVGCAAGFFLEAAKECFQVYGIELSGYSSEYARETLGHEVHTGSVFSADLPPRHFDVVVMWDVIEHLADPRRTLIRINEALKQGGILLVQTGNIDSMIARRDLAGWNLMAPPWHLYYFSKRTLCRLVEDAGFQILRVKANGRFTTSTSRFWDRSLFRRVAAFIGEGDIIRAYCRKKHDVPPGEGQC